MIAARGKDLAVLEPSGQVLFIPARLLGHQDQAAAWAERSKGGEDQFLGDLEVAEVGRIGQGHIESARLLVIAIGVEFGGDVFEVVFGGSLLNAPNGSGIRIDRMDRGGRISHG